MNDALIIVVVVLFVGIFAGVVFVVWRTRYQSVGNPFRAHKDEPRVESVILHSSDFSRSSRSGDSRSPIPNAQAASSIGDDVLRAAAIGQIATHLSNDRERAHRQDDRPSHSPHADLSSDNEVTGRADDPASDPFSSDSGSSSHDNGSDSESSSSSDSADGSDSGSGD